MAVLCLVIGVLPEPFVRLAFMGINDLPIAIGFDTASFIVIIQHISKTAALFIGVVILASIFRKFLYANKELASGDTWGCGFTQPTVRMQYTGTSYAAEMVAFFSPFVPVKNIYSGIKKIFPGTTTWESTVEDLAESNYQHGLINPMMTLLKKLRWIQHGNIQMYIGYIILAIIVLLLFL